MTPQQSALRKAIALCGNQTQFAKRLTQALAIRGDKREISQQIVSYWVNSPYGLPEAYCPEVEAIVDYQVTKHDLRPDKFGATPYVPVQDVAA